MSTKALVAALALLVGFAALLLLPFVAGDRPESSAVAPTAGNPGAPSAPAPPPAPRAPTVSLERLLASPLDEARGQCTADLLERERWEAFDCDAQAYCLDIVADHLATFGLFDEEVERHRRVAAAACTIRPRLWRDMLRD